MLVAQGLWLPLEALPAVLLLLLVACVVFTQREAQLLDRADDVLVCIAVRLVLNLLITQRQIQAFPRQRLCRRRLPE